MAFAEKTVTLGSPLEGQERSPLRTGNRSPAAFELRSRRQRAAHPAMVAREEGGVETVISEEWGNTEFAPATLVSIASMAAIKKARRAIQTMPVGSCSIAKHAGQLREANRIFKPGHRPGLDTRSSIRSDRPTRESVAPE
jgi:hypothetical protein